MRSEGIGKGSSNGNGGTNDSVTFHGFLEDYGGNNNNDDSLGSVQNRRCDGTNMTGKGKG